MDNYEWDEILRIGSLSLQIKHQAVCAHWQETEQWRDIIFVAR